MLALAGRHRGGIVAPAAKFMLRTGRHRAAAAA